MRFIALFLLGIGWSAQTFGGQAHSRGTPWRARTGAGAQQSRHGGIAGREAAKPVEQTASNEDAGYLEPAQVKDLLHKIWLAEYRINDLLTEVHQDRWKVAEAGRASFTQTLETLRKELAALEGWRTQFGERTDSLYLGFETYAAMNAVLPRLDGVARGIAEHENTSLAAQYTQAENCLFDLQQTLEPYLGFLLRNQDQMLLAVQTNLAGCQKQLGFAMQGTAGRVKVIGNTPPVRQRTRRSRVARSKSKRGAVNSPR